MKTVSPFLIFLACIAVPDRLIAARFFTMGGLIGGNTFSRPNAVSGDGSTVVGYSVSTNGIEAVRWSIQSGIVGLGDLTGGGFGSIANAVSYDGSVIVGSATQVPTCGACSGTVAVSWSGTASSISVVLGGIAASANGVSADGTVIVGARQGATSEPYFAYRNSVNIGRRINGTVMYSATGVSADGNTIVGSGNFFAPSREEATVWTPAGNVVGDIGSISGLGVISNNTNSRANAISADGSTIVGQATSSNGTEAVIFRPGPITVLGDLPGGGYESIAHGVSGDGSIVVGQAKSALGTEAFIWSNQDSRGMIRVKDYLTKFGLNLSEWELVEATDISDDGRVIVGYGHNLLGQGEGWIAVIPEPTNLTLIAILLLLKLPCRTVRAIT